MFGPPSSAMVTNNRSTHISAADNSVIFHRLDRDPVDTSKVVNILFLLLFNYMQDIVVRSAIPQVDSTTLLLPLLLRFAKKSKHNQTRDLCDMLVKHVLVVDPSKRMRANELLHSKLFRENRK